MPCLAAGARDSRHQRGQPKLRGECSMPLDVAWVCPVVFRVACCTVVSLLKLRHKGSATWFARSSERSSAYRETLCEQKDSCARRCGRVRNFPLISCSFPAHFPFISRSFPVHVPLISRSFPAHFGPISRSFPAHFPFSPPTPGPFPDHFPS